MIDKIVQDDQMILGSGILVPFSRYNTSSVNFHYTTCPTVKR
jgi:hypothetical protein